MGIRTLTYLDMSDEKRRQATLVAKDKLRALMSNPLLTEDQHKTLADQMQHLDEWGAGRIAVKRPDTDKR